ncbi:MAG: hypothetical protein K2L59_06870 [Muribaculaceae bacterium]|nr:hypothetical protein [Muribaculaceae bacterium]
MRKQIHLMLVVLLCSLGFGAYAQQISTVFRVEPGCAAVLMRYDFSTYDYVLHQYLDEGDNAVEYDRRGTLYLWPAPGAETISVTPEDDCVSRVSGKEQYKVYFTASMQDLYTVTTTGTPSMPTTDIYLAEGSHARVLEQNQRTYEYTLHQALVAGETNSVPMAMDSPDMPGTVPFYRICGDEGYVLDRVTDADGNDVEIHDDSYLGNYIEITAFTALPYYNVTTREREAPQGDPVFILSEGSYAYYTPAGGGGRTMLSPGENRVNVTENDLIEVYPADGHRFVSFTDNEGQAYAPGNRGFVQIGGSGNFYPPYSITTQLNEVDHYTVTLNIDTADGVKCYFYSDGKDISLRPGENVLTYSPNIAREYLVLGRKQFDDYRPFYSVIVDGVAEDPATEYWIEVADGMVIDVTVEYPEDESYVYTLEYTDGAEDFWTSIRVAGEEVTPEAGRFEAPAGASVELYNSNAGDWFINRITLPGSSYTSMTTYSPLTFTANGDGIISVDARRAQELGVSISILGGSGNVKVVNGNWNTGTPVNGLKDGLNTVTIKDNCDYFYIKHIDDNGDLKSVVYRESADSQLKEATRSGSWPYYYSVTSLRDGAEVIIVAGEVEHESECVVYVDRATEGLALTSDTGRAFGLSDGYNTVPFNAAENCRNGFTITGATADHTLFCDGEKAESPLRVTLADGGIYKLYTSVADPQPLAVKFEIEDETCGVADATVDLGTPAVIVEAGFEVLPGTRVSFRVTEQNDMGYLFVLANDQMIESDDDGFFTADITEPTVFTIYKEYVSVSLVGADEAEVKWFDLAGRRIEAASIVPGVYIRVAGGHADKVIVK